MQKIGKNVKWIIHSHPFADSTYNHHNIFQLCTLRFTPTHSLNTIIIIISTSTALYHILLFLPFAQSDTKHWWVNHYPEKSGNHREKENKHFMLPVAESSEGEIATAAVQRGQSEEVVGENALPKAHLHRNSPSSRNSLQMVLFVRPLTSPSFSPTFYCTCQCTLGDGCSNNDNIMLPSTSLS